MYRAQILLKPEQHRRLASLSREQRQSISEVVRNLLDEALLAHQGPVWLARSHAIERLRSLRRSVELRHGQIDRDLVAESRNERDEDSPWR